MQTFSHLCWGKRRVKFILSQIEKKCHTKAMDLLFSGFLLRWFHYLLFAMRRVESGTVHRLGKYLNVKARVFNLASTGLVVIVTKPLLTT